MEGQVSYIVSKVAAEALAPDLCAVTYIRGRIYSPIRSEMSAVGDEAQYYVLDRLHQSVS